MHYCYILGNNIDSKTYVGYTNNPQRRIRQHNGLIKGGAKYTTRCVQKTGQIRMGENQLEWYYLALITCAEDEATFTSNVALSVEWHIKHAYRKPQPHHKKVQGPSGRLQALSYVLSCHPKFMHIRFIAYITPQLLESMTEHLQELNPMNEKVKYVSTISTLLDMKTCILKNTYDGGDI